MSPPAPPNPPNAGRRLNMGYRLSDSAPRAGAVAGLGRVTMSVSRHRFAAAGNWRGGLILPVAALGLLVAGLGLLLKATRQSHGVSRVTRNIRDVVLSKPDGGLIGPWLVSAREQDPLTGEVQAFKKDGRAAGRGRV